MTTIPRLFSACLLAAVFLPAQDPDAGTGSRLAPVQPHTGDLEQPSIGPDTAPVRLARLRTPIHTAEPDNGFDYGTWAAGDDYKVSFHDGMTFVPYLGASYPTTQTLRWRTTSARCGEVELINGPAEHHRSGDFRYEYRFGAMTEAYDVLAEGLEQTFVLHHRPAGGDLVIRGAVQSLLKCGNAGAAHQELTFVDAEGRAIVAYGRAVAFDANGDRVQVATAHLDGVTTLTVPAEWLAGAAMPIVVDPLLTSVTVDLSLADVQSVDICRDDEATTANVMIALVRSASATDSDLWLRLVDDDFLNNNVVYSDITTNWASDQASCCFVGGADRFVSVFRRFFPVPTPTLSRIRCKLHDSGSTTMTTNVGFLGSAPGQNEWRPDTGGVAGFASGSNAYVVFQAENNGAGNNFANTGTSAVFGALVDATTASGTFGAPTAISAAGPTDNERPSITQSASGGATFSWVCVFQRYDASIPPAGEDWDLVGKRIAQDGSLAAGQFISDLANGPLTHQLGPVVEGRGNRYAVVFTAVDVASVPFATTQISGKQLWIERFDWTQTASAPTADYAPVLLRSNVDRRWEATGLGYDTNTRSHWTCGFRSVATVPSLPPAVGGLGYCRVGYDGNATEGPFTTLYFTAGVQAIGGNCVFDDDHDTFLFGYGANGSGTIQPIFGHAVTYATPAAPSNFGVSCSSASLDWLGSQQIGSDSGAVQITGAPATSIHFLLLATSTVNVPIIAPTVFPGCRLFVAAAGPDYLGYFPPQIGATTNYPLALPAFLASQTLYFQSIYLDGSLIYSTERLNLPIIK